MIYYLSETTGWSPTFAGVPTKEIPLWYTSDGTQSTITGLDYWYTGHLPLPAILDGCPVTSIDNWAFSYCTFLTSVAIPASVTDIGNNAFNSCSALVAIDVSANNPNYASSDGVLFDKALETLITCPGGRIGSYTIPDGTTHIGEDAFESCEFLSSVTVPASVTSIGGDAFQRCPILTAVLFTGDAPTPGYSVFYDTPATVYYLPGKNGWTSSTFAGRPAVCWNPVFSSATPASGAFSLTLSGNANASLTVYIEASESLTSPDWVILDRITIPAGGTVTFTDTDFGTYPARFYRVTLP